MIDGQTRAMAETVTAGSVQPIRAFVAHWAAVVEIERHPGTARTYHRANYLANHAATLQECASTPPPWPSSTAPLTRR